MDEVEVVLEAGEVMDLVEAEDLVRQREGEDRLCVRVLLPPSWGSRLQHC